MADDKISLELFIEADKANLSLGELEEGFESMKNRLKEVGRGSEEFKQLSTSMAQTTKEIKNIELGFEGLDKEQVASELGSVAGAVGDVTASLILMGGESETLEQIGASIEKAMAISMGMKGAIEGLSSANKLYNNLLKQGKVAVIAKSIAEKAAAAGTWLLNAANKALNLTLKMNPIGLIVTALGLAVAAIVYFKDSIWGLIKTALAPFQGAIDAVVDALQWLGIMATDEAIAAEKAAERIIKASIKRREEIAILLKVTKEANKEIIGGYDFEIKKAEAAGKSSKKLQYQRLLAIKEASIAEQKIRQEDYKQLQADWKRINDAGADATLEEIERVKTAAAANIEAANAGKEAIKNITQEIHIFKIAAIKDFKDAEDARDKAAKKAWEAGAEARALARAKESQAKKDALMEDIVIGKKVQELQTEELDMHTIHIEGLKSNEELLHDSKNFWHNKDLERIAEERAARLAATQANLQGAQQLVGSISALNSAALATQLKQAGGNEKKKEQLRKASFEREKKLQIAMALINGATAITSILAQYPKFDGGFAMVAALIASGISTIAAVAQIKATSYQGGGSLVTPETSIEPRPDGAGAGGNGANINPVSNTSTILGGQQVTVTETDITSTQNNVSVIEESATF
jgi:hypothetical protein